MTMALVWLNGTLRPREYATVSIDDLGFLYGAACFETMRAFSGTVFRLDRHLDRLEGGLAALGVTAPPRPELAAAIEATLRANALTEARIRLTVSPGPGAGRPDVGSAGPPTVLVVAEPAPPPPTAARLIVSSQYADAHRPLAVAKTANYLASVLALAEARAAGADDALLLGGVTGGVTGEVDTHEVVEAATANLFAVHEGVLLTPPLAAGPLPGVTREAVIECAQTLGIAVREQPLALALLGAADEVFLTNSIAGVRVVSAIDGWRPLLPGASMPGLVTGALAAAYAALLARECGGRAPA